MEIREEESVRQIYLYTRGERERERRWFLSQGSPSARPAVNAIFSRLVQPEREHASAEINPDEGPGKRRTEVGCMTR